jgi:hypothetical protein
MKIRRVKTRGPFAVAIKTCIIDSVDEKILFEDCV